MMVPLSAGLLATLLLFPPPFILERAEMVRVAVVLPGDDAGMAVATELRGLIDHETRLEVGLIDDELTRLAVQGSGYDGRLNLSRAEARRLGLSLGADYYILGQVIETRQQRDGAMLFEALAALFLVESRTGELLRFQPVEAFGQDGREARRRLTGRLAEVWGGLATALAASSIQLGKAPSIDEPAAMEVFTDDDGLLTGPGNRTDSSTLRPPLFQRHLKPTYPEMAARAGVEATVELTAVFRSDGQVDQIEIQRWAGFGLDESAVSTVRQLRFEAATLDGRPVSFRGLVRYNFRRPTPQAIRNSARSREEIDRLKRSLQDLLRPRPVP